MTWTYDVKNKTFTHNGKFKFHAMYAGAPGFKDDPVFEKIKNKGPLPRGKYTIVGVPFNHKTAGLYTLKLRPHASNQMFGRSGFLIHGDSRRRPGEASEGCIVLAPKFRKEIYDSDDKEVIIL